MFGLPAAGAELVHALLAEYIPFIILLTALFTVAGGIYIRGNLHGSPGLNTAILAIGAVLASLMGTTGASMLLIRPLIRANDNRRHKAHVVVFFIFIVSNVGGSLTPLGDPPLFLGFLQGRGLLLDREAHLSGDAVPGRRAAGDVLCAGLAGYYRSARSVLPVDPTPDTRAHRLRRRASTSGCWRRSSALVLLSGIWKSPRGVRRRRHRGRPARPGARRGPDRA